MTTSTFNEELSLFSSKISSGLIKLSDEDQDTILQIINTTPCSEDQYISISSENVSGDEESFILYSRSDNKDVILKKDITIPAGTVFSEAPIKTERYGSGHYMTSFAVGESCDTSGDIVYYIDPSLDEKEAEIMKSYFLYGEAIE